jgi:hypothetical protein
VSHYRYATVCIMAMMAAALILGFLLGVQRAPTTPDNSYPTCGPQDVHLPQGFSQNPCAVNENLK